MRKFIMSYHYNTIQLVPLLYRFIYTSLQRKCEFKASIFVYVVWLAKLENHMEKFVFFFSFNNGGTKWIK